NFSNFGALPCPECGDFLVGINTYLAARGDERITDWAAWVENARWRDDNSRANAENWLAFDGDAAATAAGRADRLLRSYIGRLALQMIMEENGVDLFLHPENTVPSPRIQGPNVGTNRVESITPCLQIPRVVVPAGMN